MCGIAGILGPIGDAEFELLGRMTSALRHRGPDDAGLWRSPGAALGHRRLSIIDLSAAGHQPMCDAEERFWITYNGEIYNYPELRADLSALGHHFRTQSDTEILLAAYRQWGVECLSRLNGMWAFAIYDTVEKVWFAARDRYGKKPFYYWASPTHLYFASEVKALRDVPGIPWQVNRRTLTAFFSQRVLDYDADSLYEGIQQLRPGHYWLRRPDGQDEIKAYWQLPGADQPLEESISEETLQEVDELLSEAVRMRLRADTPIGVLLSGGLDSSLVSVLAVENWTSRRGVLHLFSTLTEPITEEAKGIYALLERHQGLQTHFDTPNARGFWKDLPGLIDTQEQPFGDASMAAHYSLMRLARQSGVPVLLSGQGGDEVFGGYTSYLWSYLGQAFRQGRVGVGWRRVREARQWQRLAVMNILYHALPNALRSLVRKRRDRRALFWTAPEFRQLPIRACDSQSSSDPVHEYQKECLRALTLPGFLHYEDRNSMAFGVETRLPFLDYRLTERVLKLASTVKFNQGQTKWLLRQIGRNRLPARIVERHEKQGYPAPLGRWLRELAAEVRAVADDSVALQCPLIAHRAWRRETESFLAGRSENLDAVWRGLIAILWYDRFFGKGLGTV